MTTRVSLDQLDREQGTAGHPAHPASATPDENRIPAAAAQPSSFTRHVDVTECPRCQGETFRRRTCPLCDLTLDDDNLDAADAARRVIQSRQRAVAVMLVVAAVCGVFGFVTGYALGRRGNVAAAAQATTASEVETDAVYRALPAETRFQLHATQLRFLFNPSVLSPVQVRFTRINVPQQTAPTTGSDLTVVVADRRGWAHLSVDERQVVLGALAESQQRFLGISGEADTTGFAAMIVGRDSKGQERVLGLRDRRGTLFVK